MPHALQPLAEPFSPEVTAALDGYPRRDGYLLHLFRVFANSTRFLKKGVVNLLDRDSPLPMRQREIVILRVCAANGCEYEWGVHVAAFAAHAGLTEEQVRATWLDHAARCWDPAESLLIEVVDQLCARGNLDDAALTAFQAQWTVAQQLEIFALCGNYHTISFVANAARLQPEAFAAGVPAG
jgi:AhpD family alkylhydroperoxidase